MTIISKVTFKSDVLYNDSLFENITFTSSIKHDSSFSCVQNHPIETSTEKVTWNLNFVTLRIA